MDEKFRRLIELGAGEFEHVDGSLIAHLEGTRCLLKEWNASQVLQDAGLYHAAYSSSTDVQSAVGLSLREEVADVIGDDAENIVYHFCACDKDAFFNQFGQPEQPVFYDRITDETSTISTELLQQLCELTAANEIEVATNNPDFIAQHGPRLANVFSRVSQFLSVSAQRKIRHVFASHF